MHRLPRRFARRSRRTAGSQSEASASHVGGDRLALHLKVARLHEPRLAARLFLVSFEPAERSPRADARARASRSRRARRASTRGEAGRGASERAVRPAGQHRRAPGGERGAGFRERRSAVGERGASEHERGAPDRQGGDAIAQRGASYRECGARREARNFRAGNRRPAESDEQHRDRHDLPGRRAAGEALHAAGAQCRASDRRRHRTSAGRPGHPPRLPRSSVGCGERDRDPSRFGDAGGRSRRQLVPRANPALSHRSKHRRGRGHHVRRHHGCEAHRTSPGGARAGGEHRGRGARALPGPGRRAPRRAGEPRLLSGVSGRAGADRRPADRGSRKPSVDHPDAARAPGEGPARGHRLRRLRGGGRVSPPRTTQAALERPPVVARGRHGRRARLARDPGLGGPQAEALETRGRRR